MKTGIELITEEREKQISKGRGLNQDLNYNNNEQLSICAGLLCHTSDDEDNATKECLIDLGKLQLQNWDLDLFENMMKRDYKERLIIAGALIAAELDRFCYENEK